VHQENDLEKIPGLGRRLPLRGDRNDVVGHKNQDPKKREIILFFIKK
jgi:hypothetical protein